MTDALAVAVLVAVPLVPGALSGGAVALLALPVESLVTVIVLQCVARPWLRRAVAGVFGAVVTSSIVLAALDAGFRWTVDHPFVPSADGPRIADAYAVVRDAVGPVTAPLIVVLVAGAVGAIAVVCAGAALRVSLLLGRRRRPAADVLAVTAVWVTAALIGAHLVPGVRLAASDALGTIGATVAREEAAQQEEAAFVQALASDPYASTPADGLLRGLRGHDVVIVFVESYGRVAVEGSEPSAGVDRVLRDGDEKLTRDGYTARSAFLTSPTFGGVSWLAHATLQSGLWIDSQLKYDHVVAGDRLTLASAFRAAGWRTVSDVPSNDTPWTVGTSFYGYDQLIDARNAGYRGPAFSYARIPDQYTLAHFQRTVLAPGHDPVMAEIDLVSSHTPWTPLPSLVPWADVGDGAIFDPQPARGRSPADVWRDARDVQQLYGESIQYSLGSIFSFLHEYDDPGLVMIVLGDHQPARIVSGPDADHDVPVTIVSKDAGVFDDIASWGWNAGVRPSAHAPVWRMDAFRDRFLAAFGPG